MHDFDELIQLAYHNERVASRRLVRRDGLSEATALRLTLEQAAGAAGLAALLAARRREHAVAAARRDARLARQAAALEQRLAARQAPSGAWVGWFDGSAQPNPGRIGIGALLTGPAGERIEISRRAGHGNSGEAEYAALIALLQAALPLRPPMLVLRGDSRVVIDDVNGSAGAAGLAAQRAQVRALLAQLPQATLGWIPRHRNGAADLLSQQSAALPHADDDTPAAPPPGAKPAVGANGVDLRCT